MAIPTVAVFVRLYEQDGEVSPRSIVRAQLQGMQVYQGHILPEVTEVMTDEHGYATMHLWPNVLGVVPSTYKITIVDEATNKSFRFYVVVPNYDIYLDQLTPVDPMGDNPLDPNRPPLPGTPGQAATITVGTVTTVAPNLPAKVTNSGTLSAARFDFELPKGDKGDPGTNGINGTGTMVVGTVTTLPPGSNATVQNVGTADRAVLNFGLPRGEPGTTVVVTDPGTGTPTNIVGIPDGGIEGQVLTKNGNTPYAVQWRTPATVTNPTQPTQGTSFRFHAPYTWEGGTPPVVDPGLAIMDSTTLAAYRAAVAATPVPNKRTAAANAVIAQMGNSQRMIVRRNGVQILSATFTGPMTLGTDANDVFVNLSALASVSPIVAADSATGTWTTTISGGVEFERTLLFSAGADAPTAVGQGFNPDIRLIVPRSLDGQA